MVPTTESSILLSASLASQKSRRLVLLSLYLLRHGQRRYTKNNHLPDVNTGFGQEERVIVSIETDIIAKRVSCIMGNQ